MFNKIPILASVTNTDVPPEEISGSGIPFVGSSESTTLILKNACNTIVVVMPKATNHANGSCDRNAARRPRQPKTANRTTIRMEPMNPSSSAMLAKIKSVDASGR